MRAAAAVLQREVARNASAHARALRAARAAPAGSDARAELAAAVPPLGWVPQPNQFLGLWEPATVAAGSSATSVAVDVAPFHAAGRDVLAVRYGWPITDGTGSCCPGGKVHDGLAACIPGSCPLFAKDSGFPANPFFAAIVDGGDDGGAASAKCQCRAPQVCDA